MKAIVAVDKNWGIGCNGKLLIHNPIDLQFFKEKTNGNIVVMGRKTLESLPNGEPLKGRINIVLTRDKDYHKDGVIVFNNIFDFLISEYVKDNTYVIGGSEIYNQLLNCCDEIFVTKMENTYESDTFFPNLDKLKYKIIEESNILSFNDISFKFLTYKL